jgi:ferrous iron transport protein B
VYSLLIAAFIPDKELSLGISLQGLVLFLLYLSGILGALIIAWILKKITSNRSQVHPLLMELPEYRLPSVQNILIGLWQRVLIFLRRVGGTLMVLTIGLWFLASYPAAPVDATRPVIEYSFAGMLGKLLSHFFAPIGFNWEISIALIPGYGS